MLLKALFLLIITTLLLTGASAAGVRIDSQSTKIKTMSNAGPSPLSSAMFPPGQPFDAPLAPPAKNVSTVSFTPIDVPQPVTYDSQTNRAVTNETDWDALWTELTKGQTPPPAKPTVDFTKQMVIAAFSGPKASSGYTLKINSVHESSDNVLVALTETAPGDNCSAATTITYPLALATVQKINKTVIFSINHDTKPCQ